MANCRICGSEKVKMLNDYVCERYGRPNNHPELYQRPPEHKLMSGRPEDGWHKRSLEKFWEVYKEVFLGGHDAELMEAFGFTKDEPPEDLKDDWERLPDFVPPNQRPGEITRTGKRIIMEEDMAHICYEKVENGRPVDYKFKKL